MVVLGLILLLVAVVAGVVLVAENSGGGHTVSVSAFGGEWRVDLFWVAVVGAAILLVAVLGIALMRSGTRRSRRRRQERKALERENAALADRVRHGDDTSGGQSAHSSAHPPAHPPAYVPDNGDHTPHEPREMSDSDREIERFASSSERPPTDTR